MANTFTHVKISMRIVEANGNSETESWYYAATDLGTLSPTRSGAVAIADNLVAKRAQCLVKSWQVLSVRISPAPIPKVETPPRVSFNFPAINGQGVWTVQPDIPAAVALTTVHSANGHTRKAPLHGQPDDNARFQSGTGQELNPGLAVAVRDFLTFLTTPPRAMLRVELNPAKAGQPIGDITVADNNVVTFMCPGLGGGVATGDKFLVSSCKGYKASQFNGHWAVGSYNATTGALVASTRRFIDRTFFYAQASGTIRLDTGANVGFDEVTKFDDIAPAATHKLGNAFTGRRGRRSARR